MTLQVDKDGVVTNPDFHDGDLLGIFTPRDPAELTLFLRTDEGIGFKLTIPDVVRALANNFSEGNIVLQLIITEGGKVSAEAVRKLFHYDDAQPTKPMPDQMKQIADEGWTLVEVTSSYGCELLAISRAHADKLKVERY